MGFALLCLSLADYLLSAELALIATLLCMVAYSFMNGLGVSQCDRPSACVHARVRLRAYVRLRTCLRTCLHALVCLSPCVCRDACMPTGYTTTTHAPNQSNL